MLESINEMFMELNKNNIVYCHWKSNEHLTPALDGDTDLDMLFLPEQRSNADVIFNSVGMKRFRSTPLSQYNGVEDYIGFDAKEAKIWHLHLHDCLTFGEKNLKGYTVNPWRNAILEKRIINDDGVYTSCPEHELILLIVRMALKLRWRDTFSKISIDDQKEIAWLLNRIDKKKLNQYAIDFLGVDNARFFMSLIETELIYKNQLVTMQKRMRRHLKHYTGYSLVSSWFVRTVREGYSIIGGATRRLFKSNSFPYRRVSPAGGCVVAFVGSDGAGKSTTIDYIRKEFSKKLDVKVVYLGSGDGGSSLIRKPMKIVAKKVGGRGLGESVEKEYSGLQDSHRKISLKSRVYSIAKVIWASTLANEKKSKLKQITKCRNRGMLVLLDRYPQTVVEGIGDGPMLTRYREKGRGFLYKLAEKELHIYRSFEINPPDLMIKLIVPTEIAIERKPEMTAFEVERKKEAVLSIHSSIKESIIDTSVDKKESFSKAMKAIWEII